MRLSVIVASAVLIAAGLVTLGATSKHLPGFVATVILVSATVATRLAAVQRWLSAPRDKREKQVQVLAQQALVEIFAERQMSADLIGMAVHVWAVPLWYRHVFWYRLRNYLRQLALRRKVLSRWIIRPYLQRVAAVSLLGVPPSGVRFRKGRGLIGVCLANNDRSEIITLNANSTSYRSALNSASEEEWRRLEKRITHDISLAEAKTLAKLYCQVIAKVVNDRDSGDAVGCVTISLKACPTHTNRLDHDEVAKKQLADLALSLGPVL